jgi:hypothetical protein
MAPMSRNMRPQIIDGPGSLTCTAGGLQDVGSPDYNVPAGTGHQGWKPIVENVVGLDAAVILTGSGQLQLNSVQFNTFTDSNPFVFQDATCTTQLPKYTPLAKAIANGRDANNNTITITQDLNNASAFNNPSSTVNYNQIMSVILSGVDGSGSLAACADPRRVAAVRDFSVTGLGLTGSIQHVLRRDDNSGTTDTFKDRIMVVTNTGSIATRYPWTGGRFCNGTAVGSISGSAPQQGVCSAGNVPTCVQDADCQSGSGAICLFNGNNQDFDPIRRPCMDATAGRRPTSCTNMLSGAPCNAGDASCTQGLVVALSDADDKVAAGNSRVTDVTTSIGYRVGSSSLLWIGYAGREAADATNFGTKSLAINTIRPTDENVISSNYLLARRLYVQSGDKKTVPFSTGTPKDAADLPGATCGQAQVDAEQALFSLVLSNRTIMDPIVRNLNFIRCSRSADGGDPSGESNNLCSLAPFGATPGAFGALSPSGAVSGNNGGRKSIDSQGRLWNPTTQTASNVGLCAGTETWVSGKCTAAGADVPLYTGRSFGSACSQNSDCTSNNCTNLLGHGAAGQVYGLYCGN